VGIFKGFLKGGSCCGFSGCLEGGFEGCLGGGIAGCLTGEIACCLAGGFAGFPKEFLLLRLELSDSIVRAFSSSSVFRESIMWHCRLRVSILSFFPTILI